MRFRIKRCRTPGSAYPWQAEIWEEFVGGGWEGKTISTYRTSVYAFTRLGLRIEVRKHCRYLLR